MRFLIPACLLLLALTGFHALTVGNSACAAVRADADAVAGAPKSGPVSRAPAAPVAPAAPPVFPLLLSPVAPADKAAPGGVASVEPVFRGQEAPRSSFNVDDWFMLGSHTRLVGRAQGIFPLLLGDRAVGESVFKDGGPRIDSDHAARVELGLRYTF